MSILCSTAIVQGTAQMSGAWTPVALSSACVIVSSSGSHSWSHPKRREIRSKYLLLIEMLVVSTGRHSSSFFNTVPLSVTVLQINFLVCFCLCQSVCSCDQVLWYDVNNKWDFFYLTRFVFVLSCVNVLNLLCEYNVLCNVIWYGAAALVEQRSGKPVGIII